MHFSFFLSFFRGKVDLHISKRSKGKIEGKTKSIVSRGVQKRRKDGFRRSRESGVLFFTTRTKKRFFIRSETRLLTFGLKRALLRIWKWQPPKLFFCRGDTHNTRIYIYIYTVHRHVWHEWYSVDEPSRAARARFVLHVRDCHLPEPDWHVRRVHQNTSGHHRRNTKAMFGHSLQPMREVFTTAETLDTRGFRE